MEKGEVIPDNTAPKSYHPIFVKNYYSDPQYEFRDQTVKAGKISQQMGLATHFLNGASQEIKVKLNEIWQLKFYQVKQLKKNSTKNFAEKNLKEDLELNEIWNISTRKKKRKEKYSNSKNFISRTLSRISFLEIVLKYATVYLFLSLSFLFLLHKIPSKNFIVCVIFSNHYLT